MPDGLVEVTRLDRTLVQAGEGYPGVLRPAGDTERADQGDQQQVGAPAWFGVGVGETWRPGGVAGGWWFQAKSTR